jgi:hypothetical protein
MKAAVWAAVTRLRSDEPLDEEKDHAHQQQTEEKKEE